MAVTTCCCATRTVAGTTTRWTGVTLLPTSGGLAGLTRNLDWHVAGIGDLNGDGRDDVLLRHTDSRWYYYPMNGRRFLTDARGYAGLTRNLAWQVAGIGDLNGDGRDDVLLRHTDSRWYYYPMEGRSYLADARGYANLTRNPDWSVADTDTLAPERHRTELRHSRCCRPELCDRHRHRRADAAGRGRRVTAR